VTFIPLDSGRAVMVGGKVGDGQPCCCNTPSPPPPTGGCCGGGETFAGKTVSATVRRILDLKPAVYASGQCGHPCAQGGIPPEGIRCYDLTKQFSQISLGNCIRFVSDGTPSFPITGRLEIQPAGVICRLFVNISWSIICNGRNCATDGLTPRVTYAFPYEAGATSYSATYYQWVDAANCAVRSEEDFPPDSPHTDVPISDSIKHIVTIDVSIV
jgi:hypothetical protein